MILLLPIFLLVVLMIRVDSKGPFIFKQQRLGKHGKVFEIYKFRSMTVGAEQKGSGVYSSKGDVRVTRVGRLIRSISIDELPQLVNILRGDMSFIGPRPPLTYHPWPIDEYTSEQKKMFCVRPGITGWAQVNGRKTVEWNQRIEMSCWYATNIRLILDIRIFFLTIWKVLSREKNENVGKTIVCNATEKSQVEEITL